MTEEKNQENSPNKAGSSTEAEKELFDLLIPPGVPRSIIADIIQKFDVELVERKQRLHFANMDGDERELLAFRGTRPVMEKVQDFMFAELKKFIEER
ncbi:MAG: hypothetical protein A4E37_01124 [Methanoregulaceae archaeon PtaB.Bin056]|jgi:hypothetical protein|nr:MAG: hypothetical protein A4E37_01124 [Methanoregulaceae archaeon PtaB.Bin056]